MKKVLAMILALVMALSLVACSNGGTDKNSRFMALAEHKPYSPLQPDGTQVFHSPVQKTVEIMPERLLIMDTDQGAVLTEKVDDLTDLVEAFKEGLIKEVY